MRDELECCGNCCNRSGLYCSTKHLDFSNNTLYFRGWCDNWEFDQHDIEQRKEFHTIK